MLLRRVLKRKFKPQVPVISVGNLTVGGSGKTPFLISLIKSLKLKNRKIAVISRGYGRKSKGFVRVSSNGKILTDVKKSGDEAMLIAESLNSLSLNVDMIVSEDRKEALNLAVKEGVDLIFLDDGFNRVEIKKFEILLYPPNLKNIFPIPAGGFREFSFVKKFANLNLVEDKDFFREVEIINSSNRMVLVTAISNPKRLDKWLDDRVVAKYYLKDHDWFNESKLVKLLKKFDASKILVTEKDFVKLKDSNIPISLMRLDITIKPYVLESVKNYIKRY